jgi:hypothetical protein
MPAWTVSISRSFRVTMALTGMMGLSAAPEKERRCMSRGEIEDSTIQDVVACRPSEHAFQCHLRFGVARRDHTYAKPGRTMLPLREHLLFCSQDLSTAISISQSFLKDEHLYDHQLDNRLACSSTSLCTRRPDPRNCRGSRQRDFAAAMTFSMKGLMKRHQLKSQYAGTDQSEDLLVDLLAPIACRLVPRTVFTDLARQS